MKDKRVWARAEVIREEYIDRIMEFPVEITYGFGIAFHTAEILIPPIIKMHEDRIKKIIIRFMGKDYNITKPIPDSIVIPIINHDCKAEDRHIREFTMQKDRNCRECGKFCFTHDLIDDLCTLCRYKVLERTFPKQPHEVPPWQRDYMLRGDPNEQTENRVSPTSGGEPDGM